MTDRQTVAGAYAKAEEAVRDLKAHEDICAERYGSINTTLQRLETATTGQSRILWGIVLSIAGFAVMTLLAIVLHALKLA